MAAPGFRLLVTADHEAMSRRAAAEIVAAAEARPGLLLCAASGATPSRAYQLLERHREAFQQARLVKLDEWGGLNLDDPGSSDTQIRRELVAPLSIDEHRFMAFRGDLDDPARECQRVSSWLDAAGAIDMAVLGLGLNGHLGFNEPAAELQLRPHVATLSETSRTHSMVALARGTATYGMTLGMGDLMAAERVLLVVSGEAKQAALKRLCEGAISTDFPASFLRVHQDALCLCDMAAAVQLSGRL